MLDDLSSNFQYVRAVVGLANDGMLRRAIKELAIFDNTVEWVVAREIVVKRKKLSLFGFRQCL